MDDNGQRESSRHKADHYKTAHAQVLTTLVLECIWLLCPFSSLWYSNSILYSQIKQGASRF